VTEQRADVRPLGHQDLNWVVQVTRERRESLAQYAPRFWNPTTDAAERHRAFLEHLIADPAVLSVRYRNGFLIAVDRGEFCLVDDMVVTPEDDWATVGPRLLEHALDRCGRIRFVVPIAEPPRRAAAEAVGLTAVECWWHRDLPALNHSDEYVRQRSDISVDGAQGRLVPAPPVYYPGGPVLLVTGPVSAVALLRIEAAAASEGATVAVVSQNPNDEAMGRLLADAGYMPTTMFYESPTTET